MLDSVQVRIPHFTFPVPLLSIPSAHAKGFLLTGTFTPTPLAGTLSIAPQFTAPSTPIIVRFSNSTGIPNIPDFDGNANPRGIGLRFMYGERKHTDIIAHSTNGFPTRTGEEFLGFLQALAASPPGGPSPSPIETFLGAHPAAFKFATTPKPTPVSFAKEEYFGVNSFKLVDAAGKGTFIRYRIIPDLGVETLNDEQVKGKDVDFLQIELKDRVGSGPVSFKLVAQVADGDVTDDATIPWPDSREIVELGSVVIDKALDAEESLKQQKYIIFDPVPRVAGVEPSEDPLLEMRAALYLISGKERRAAP